MTPLLYFARLFSRLSSILTEPSHLGDSCKLYDSRAETMSENVTVSVLGNVVINTKIVGIVTALYRVTDQ